MENHRGLITVLKTPKGYITESGRLTQDIREAKKIEGLEFSYRTDYEIARKLGYYDLTLTKRDYKSIIIEPSYDMRREIILSYLRDLGYDLKDAITKSECDFYTYDLVDIDEYHKYIDKLHFEVYDHFQVPSRKEQIKFDNEDIELYRSDARQNNEEYTITRCYSSDEVLYKYVIPLKQANLEKYFNNMSTEEYEYYNNYQNNGLLEYIKCNLSEMDNVGLIEINDGSIELFTEGYYNSGLIYHIMDLVRKFYSSREMHITRMFGSYILLIRENGELKAVKSTPIPIKYCPLMIKLLKEVGGELAEKLIASLNVVDEETQTKMMCELINEVVIKGGYFDTNRPLNSCEANVLFGASETMSSAFKSGMIDAAVIVSNNLGTIITYDDATTQGAVKRMTGLFYTSPDESIMNTANSEEITPVFPYTAKIDQLAGVKKAISMGEKRIAVSVAAQDNYLHEELKKLETNGVKIYKFGLCSTGIDEKTAEIMKSNADVVWSCASKYVKEIIEPAAIAQVGVKIPVHIITESGYEIVKNHLDVMNGESIGDVNLTQGDDKPVFVNSNGKVKKLTKKELNHCNDCPHPCI